MHLFEITSRTTGRRRVVIVTATCGADVVVRVRLRTGCGRVNDRVGTVVRRITVAIVGRSSTAHLSSSAVELIVLALVKIEHARAGIIDAEVVARVAVHRQRYNRTTHIYVARAHVVFEDVGAFSRGHIRPKIGATGVVVVTIGVLEIRRTLIVRRIVGAQVKRRIVQLGGVVYVVLADIKPVVDIIGAVD